MTITRLILRDPSDTAAVSCAILACQPVCAWPPGRCQFAQLAAMSLVVEHGQVTRIYVVANPRKLTRLDEPADLAR
jgi:hypothetical protein